MSMDIPGWARIAGAVIGAGIAAYFSASAATGDKVSDNRFDRVTITNCQSINELKEVLSEILLSVPLDPTNPEATEDFVQAAVRKLETTDCSLIKE